MKTIAVVLAISAAVAASLAAFAPDRVERVMTLALIEEAMTTKFVAYHYPLDARGTRLLPGLSLGRYSTPFSRIAEAAAEARRHYETFTASNVTDEMKAAELVLYVPAYNASGLGSSQDIRNVETVVITTKSAPATPVRPLRTVPLTEQYQNIFGAKLEGRGLVAVFPLDLLQEDNEVHVVYDVKWNCGGRKGEPDCAAPFKLKNVR